METKLTLKLNEQIIEKAKAYARSRNTSLSKLIENFLSKVTAEPVKNEDISPLVKSLSGVISENIKKNYRDYLSEKYK